MNPFGYPFDDGTCFANDWISPTDRLAVAYRTAGQALKDDIEKEEAAIRFLRERGWKVIKGTYET